MSQRSTILLLEDDAMLIDLMQDGLREDGFTVVPLRDGDALTPALDSLNGDAILVADRNIGPSSGPGANNGFDLAAAALERYPALRVIYVSGTQLALKHRQLSTRERVLLKPFAISQLTGLVRRLL